MKQLTKSAVKNAMLLLLETNGYVTTLEVKTHLRDLGYHAVQTEVSTFMSEISDETSEITFSENGTYRIYSYVMVNDDEDEDDDEYCESWNEWDDDEQIDETETDDENDVDAEVLVGGIFDEFISDEDDKIINDFNTSFTKKDTVASKIDAFNATIDGTSTGKVIDLSKPMNLGHYYTADKAVNSVEATDNSNVWIVRAKPGIYPNTPFYTFEASLTSDKVRSRYATLTNTKIQDVRACRAHNYKL